MTRTFSWFGLLLICVSLCFASGGGDAPIADEPIATELDNWIYGKIEYRHDLLAPNLYFMVLRAYPGKPVPLVTGGYATTDVYAVVRLRGVDVPRGLQVSADRERPHDWLSNERERWDASMGYLWKVISVNRTFRVHNLAVVDDAGDRVLEGDLEVWLGGQWLSLALLMLNDGHARPEQLDGTQWDWGMRTVPLVNREVPK